MTPADEFASKGNGCSASDDAIEKHEPESSSLSVRPTSSPPIVLSRSDIRNRLVSELNAMETSSSVGEKRVCPLSSNYDENDSNEASSSKKERYKSEESGEINCTDEVEGSNAGDACEGNQINNEPATSTISSDDAIEKHGPASFSPSVRPFKLRVLSKSEIRNRLVSELNAMETSSSVGEKRVCPLSSNSDENNSNEASSSKKARYKTEESDEINCTDAVEGSNAGDACEENQINVEPATSTISSDDAIEKHGPESFSPSVHPFKLGVPSKSEIRNRLLSELNAMETSSSVGEKHLCPLSSNSDENDSNEASSSKKARYKTEESDEINCTDAVEGSNADDACEENQINVEPATSTISSDDAIEKHGPESFSPSVRPFKLDVPSKSEIRNRLLSELNAMETSSSVGEKHLCPLSSNSDENDSNEACSSKKSKYKTEESGEINCTDAVGGSNASDACKENHINKESATSTILVTGRPQNGMESQVEKADSVGNTANVFVIKTEPTDTDAPTCAPSVSATSADTRVKPADRVKKEEATSTSRESCKFGIRCYRRNPMHRIEEAHPGDHDYRRPNYPPPPVGTPDCPYGDACYRRNPIHFEQFSHPPETDFEHNWEAHRLRLRQRLQQTKDNRNCRNGAAGDSSSEVDDYELEDPFIDDGALDEDYVPSNDENDDDDEEYDECDRAEE